jgi:hypothetical protein
MKMSFENSKYSGSNFKLKPAGVNTQSYHNINMIKAPSPINTARPIMYNPNYNDIQPRGASPS